MPWFPAHKPRPRGDAARTRHFRYMTEGRTRNRMKLSDMIRQGLRRKQAQEEQRTTPNPAQEAADTSSSLLDPDRQQDDFSTRAKNSRHKKVTAENWNQ